MNDSETTPRLPWWRNDLPRASQPSRFLAGGWSAGVFLDDHDKLTAKLWRAAPRFESHVLHKVRTVREGEAWCEALFELLADRPLGVEGPLCRLCHGCAPREGALACAACFENHGNRVGTP